MDTTIKLINADVDTGGNLVYKDFCEFLPRHIQTINLEGDKRMQNTKENIIKILEKIIECDRRLVKESKSKVVKREYTQDIVRLQGVIRMMTDHAFFETYWRLFVDNKFEELAFDGEN